MTASMARLSTCSGDECLLAVPVNTFEHAGRANQVGFASLRPVQELAGEAILDGKNAVVASRRHRWRKNRGINLPGDRGSDDGPRVASAPSTSHPRSRRCSTNQEVRPGECHLEMVGLQRPRPARRCGQSSKAHLPLREPAELPATTIPESMEVMLMSPCAIARKLFLDLRYVVIDEVHVRRHGPWRSS